MPYTKQPLTLIENKMTIEINCDSSWYLKTKDLCGPSFH